MLEKLSDPELRADLAVVRDSGNYLLALLNNYLDLAKLSRGRMSLEALPVCLAAVCGQAVAMLRSRAEPKRLSLVVDLPLELPAFVGDPIRVQQVMSLLLLIVFIRLKRAGCPLPFSFCASSEHWTLTLPLLVLVVLSILFRFRFTDKWLLVADHILR